MANIVVNSNSSGPNFTPSTYPSSGHVPFGGTISFQANSNSSISFYAYQNQNGTKVNAFTAAPPYTAPKAGSSPNTYTLASGLVTGAVTLSLTNPSLSGDGDRVDGGGGGGSNGTINVGQ